MEFKGKISSYLKESAFINGLNCPYRESRNFCGLNDIEDKRNVKSGMYCSIQRYDLNELNCGSLRKYIGNVTSENDIRYDIKGNYRSTDEKIGFYFYDARSEKVSRIENSAFKVVNIGDFISSVMISEDEVVIETNISVLRISFGINYEGKTISGSFYNNDNYSDHKLRAMIKDEYRISKDRKYLIHTTNLTPNFAVYDLPENFKITDGVKNLKRSGVFVYDKSLSEEEMISIHVKSKNK